MYTESQYLAISGLQHLAFCERRCALIHLEQLWTENILTAEGRLMHDNVHSPNTETRGDLIITRSLPLHSQSLGLTGVADAVEFHRSENATLQLPKHKGAYFAFPVEYKHGTKKSFRSDSIQLCAQALCLEEMLQTEINEGALYYGKTKSRTAVVFDDNLRTKTKYYALRFHQLMETGETPPPKPGPHCKQCSLVDDCMPQLSGKASLYIDKMLEQLSEQQM
ncbi:MAG: CRISPR-associated protein Cas4 [Planctomycetaceae bacterium]|jgi:CRISPR-associated exonuclease Cas4|nr:CRISPR-associated protein Cas4 [Planctomycetaceae bacterium]